MVNGNYNIYLRDTTQAGGESEFEVMMGLDTTIMRICERIRRFTRTFARVNMFARGRLLATSAERDTVAPKMLIISEFRTCI